MSIRFAIWLGAMACAALLVVALGLLVALLGSWPLAGALVLAAFAPLAWWLARLAFHPVRDVTKTARSITTTGELDRRCFYPGPRDDVGELVVTVNELLVRYDAAIGRLRRLQAAQPACACPRPTVERDGADLVVLDLLDREGPRQSGRPEAEASRPGS
jgi:hypothetical protein